MLRLEIVLIEKQYSVQNLPFDIFPWGKLTLSTFLIIRKDAWQVNIISVIYYAVLISSLDYLTIS